MSDCYICRGCGERVDELTEVLLNPKNPNSLYGCPCEVEE